MKRAGSAAILLAAGALAGCQTPVGPVAEPLVARTDHPIPDVPVPAPFAIDRGESLDHTSPTMRLIRHVYTARSVSPAAVARFYRRQMPIGSWQPLGEVEGGGGRLMAFGRGDEKCLIHIGRDRWPVRTIIAVEVIGQPAR